MDVILESVSKKLRFASKNETERMESVDEKYKYLDTENISRYGKNPDFSLLSMVLPSS